MISPNCSWATVVPPQDNLTNFQSLLLDFPRELYNRTGYTELMCSEGYTGGWGPKHGRLGSQLEDSRR